jgi:predicted NUDIX family NTP pyrophosphohydrolase
LQVRLIAAKPESKPMAKQSAGILLYRRDPTGLSVLLVHPGGPFWANKDLGAWSIPKGEYGSGEDPLAVAVREFEEETGARPEGEFRPLGEVRQAGGKRVLAWALEGDLDPAEVKSNSFELEWLPKCGRKQSFPEIDRAEWFSAERAREKILPSQREFIDRLEQMLA